MSKRRVKHTEVTIDIYDVQKMAHKKYVRPLVNVPPRTKYRRARAPRLRQGFALNIVHALKVYRPFDSSSRIQMTAASRQPTAAAVAAVTALQMVRILVR